PPQIETSQAMLRQLIAASFKAVNASPRMAQELDLLIHRGEQQLVICACSGCARAQTEQLAQELEAFNAGASLGSACGTDVGACAVGVVACAGPVLSCLGEVPPSPEVRDGIDNNCDGVIDDGVPPCAPWETVCDFECVDTSSSTTDCGACGVACAAGESCFG